MPIPVPQQQNFSITPMLNAHAMGQQSRLNQEDRQREWDQRAQDAIIRAAEMADTPEKWSRFVETIQGQFPDADLSEFTDFSSREAAIGQSMDPYQRAQLDISQQQLALQQQAAARAAQGSAPAPMTEMGQIAQDLNNGFINPEQAAQLAAGILGNGENPPDFGSEADLRGEFMDLVGDFSDVEASYRRILSSADEPSAAGDLALVFNYMKMLDPGSAVRETEFANAQNAAGVPERIRAMYNNLISGEILGETQRADFLNRAGQLYGSQLEQYNSYGAVFQNLAAQQGLDPNRVVTQRDLPEAPGGIVPIGPYQAPQSQPTQAAPAPAAGGGEIIAVNPETGERVRFNQQTGQWEPM